MRVSWRAIEKNWDLIALSAVGFIAVIVASDHGVNLWLVLFVVAGPWLLLAASMLVKATLGLFLRPSRERSGDEVIKR